MSDSGILKEKFISDQRLTYFYQKISHDDIEQIKRDVRLLLIDYYHDLLRKGYTRNTILDMYKEAFEKNLVYKCEELLQPQQRQEYEEFVNGNIAKAIIEYKKKQEQKYPSPKIFGTIQDLKRNPDGSVDLPAETINELIEYSKVVSHNRTWGLFNNFFYKTYDKVYSKKQKGFQDTCVLAIHNKTLNDFLKDIRWRYSNLIDYYEIDNLFYFALFTYVYDRRNFSIEDKVSDAHVVNSIIKYLRSRINGIILRNDRYKKKEVTEETPLPMIYLDKPVRLEDGATTTLGDAISNYNDNLDVLDNESIYRKIERIMIQNRPWCWNNNWYLPIDSIASILEIAYGSKYSAENDLNEQFADSSINYVKQKSRRYYKHIVYSFIEKNYLLFFNKSQKVKFDAFVDFIENDPCYSKENAKADIFEYIKKTDTASWATYYKDVTWYCGIKLNNTKVIKVWVRKGLIRRGQESPDLKGCQSDFLRFIKNIQSKMDTNLKQSKLCIKRVEINATFPPKPYCVEKCKDTFYKKYEPKELLLMDYAGSIRNAERKRRAEEELRAFRKGKKEYLKSEDIIKPDNIDDALLNLRYAGYFGGSKGIRIKSTESREDSIRNYNTYNDNFTEK